MKAEGTLGGGGHHLWDGWFSTKSCYVGEDFGLGWEFAYG